MNARFCPTLLGYIGDITGSCISARQAECISSGIAIIGGKSYRVGQVGTFVRIPQGYHDLYGIISETGVNAAPQTIVAAKDRADRWMSIQLVGEMVGSAFERGISQFPSINDEVHLVTEEDLANIYGTDESGQVTIGRLASADGIPVRIDLDKLVTRHSAVLGSTGSGKSTTVASLLRSIVTPPDNDNGQFQNARILLLDLHGEYGNALSDVAEVFRVSPSNGEKPLYVPYWALDPTEFLPFAMGKLDDKALTQILDKVVSFKASLIERRQNNGSPIQGVDPNALTSDSPIPYSLKKLWYELLDVETKTWADREKTTAALEAAGDIDRLIPPKYQPASPNNTAPYINHVGVLSIRRQLDQLRSRLLDRQFDFLMHPGDWEPDQNGDCAADLPELLNGWLGHDKPITILDLSGIPSTVIVRLIGVILRIIYEGLFWGREKSEGGISRPQLIVMEEAHRYLAPDIGGPACSMVQRIVKEGRKFGIGAMVVSQRPSEVDETILSQCGTFFALRLSNAADRSKVQAALPDSLSGVIDSLPVLRTGETIIVGEAARLPIRCRITLPKDEHRPNSEDPHVAANWRKNKVAESYERLVASWRSQNPRWVQKQIPRHDIQPQGEEMDRNGVSSSTIVSIGYDSDSSTLEIEFRNGIYQYYNVPDSVYQALMESGSHGRFFHANIKGVYPCSRV